MKNSIGIVGSGSWGLALAIALSKSKSTVKVLFNCKKKFQDAVKKRKFIFFPKVLFPKKIVFTLNISEILNSDYIFLVTP